MANAPIDPSPPPFPNTMPSFLYGRGTELQERLGLNLVLSEQLAAIVVFAANIENWLEHAIWHLRGSGPTAGARPDTDAKTISDLLRMLDDIVSAQPSSDTKSLLETWSKAAHSGFTIRSNIVHGMIVRLDTSVAFMRNTQWEGVLRKRPFGDLWADHHTLDMIRDSFAVLLRVIYAVAQGKSDLGSDELITRAVREARSILGEFSSRDYNPAFEKY